MGTMTCPDCSTEVPDSESKCSKCGKSIIKAPPHAFLDEVRNRNSARTMLPAMIVILCLLFAFGTEKWVEIFEAAKSIAGIVDERPKDPYPNWESFVVTELTDPISSMSWIEQSKQMMVVSTALNVHILNTDNLINTNPPKVQLDAKYFFETLYSGEKGGWLCTPGPKGLLVVGPKCSLNKGKEGGVRIQFDLWDIPNRKMIRSIDAMTKFSGFGSPDTASKIHPDGKLMAVHQEGQIKIWNIFTGKVQSYYRGGHWGISFNENGSLLAGRSMDRLENDTVSIWDITTGEKLYEMGNNGWGRNGIELSPDGSMVALTLGGIQIRETKTGDVLHTTAGNRPMVFSPDGNLLAFGNGHQIIIQNVSSGEILYELKGLKVYPTSLLFGDDGKTLISGDESGLVRIWKKPD